VNHRRAHFLQMKVWGVQVDYVDELLCVA
jgi:hypothetical protein